MGNCLTCFKNDEFEIISENENALNHLGRRSSLLSQCSTDVVEADVLIGSFNVRRFGPAKMKDRQVVKVLIDVLRRYDVVLVQEIVDASGEALKELMVEINSGLSDTDKFSMEVSPRIGRNKAKEQYAFIYKQRRFLVADSGVYEDTRDIFIRDPFVVKFSTKCLDSQTEVVLIGVHTQPSNANLEIDHLDDVREWATKKFSCDVIFILGDLNASAPYIKSTDWSSNRLRTDSDYHWLIPDHLDTTANHTLAAYDRIIAYGDSASNLVIPSSAKAFRYDAEMGDIGQDLMLNISDHYPVEVELRARRHPEIEGSIRVIKNIILIEDKRPILQDINLEDTQPFSVTKFYDTSKKIVRAEFLAEFETMDEIGSALKNLRDKTSLAYSLFRVASNATRQLSCPSSSIRVKISYDFTSQKTEMIIF